MTNQNINPNSKKTNKIILFSKIESLCNVLLNGILLSLNSIFFIVGIYFLLAHSENINKKEGIQDCGNVFISIGFFTLNCLIILIFIPRALILSIFAFCSSLLLCLYSTYNIETMNNTCITYYDNNYNNLWLYYTFSIGLLYINVILFLFKYCSFIDIKNNENDIELNTEETDKLIRGENVLQNDNNNLDNNLDNTMNNNMNPPIHVMNDNLSGNIYEDISQYHSIKHDNLN